MSSPQIQNEILGRQEQLSSSIMGPETNPELISDSEKQVREGKGDTIQLKRSMLNISVRLSPKILGDIFFWIVARDRNHSLRSGTHFSGLERGSHNFLLVCHRWFEVASNIPELWSFWGNSVRDWEKSYHHNTTAPVDLVLDGYASHPEEDLSDPLRDALKACATRDGIRQIHLKSDNLNLLTSIFFSLTPNESAQRKCIESVILWTTKIAPEFSTFLARAHLPNLQYLHIIGVLQTPLWDHLAFSQTTRLTTLSLRFTGSSLPPAISKVLSILTSNANLQELELSDAALPDEVDEPGTKVALCHLRTIALAGKFRRVFGLLRRLELPVSLDYLHLSMDDLTTKDISQTLGQYMQDHFKRDTKFRDRLTVTAFRGYVDVSAGQIGSRPEESSLSDPPSTRFTVSIIAPPPDPLTKTLTIDLLSYIPRQYVVSFKTEYSLEVREDIFVAMPNVETLRLHDATTSDGFLQPDPKGPYASAKLFPSLRHLILLNFTADDAGWGPLTAYLVHQTSGDRTIALELTGYCSYIPPKVAKEIQDIVQTFVHDPILDIEYSEEDDGDDEDYEEYELEGWEGDEGPL